MSPSDSNGNYSLPDGSIVSSGTTATAASQNTPNNDIAAALSARLMASGAKKWTGTQDADGNTVTGLKDAVAPTDAVPLSQYQEPATDEAAGIVRLATEEEAEAGTEDGAVVLNPALAAAQTTARLATTEEIFEGAEDRLVGSEALADSGNYTVLSFATTLNTNCDLGLRFQVEATDDFTLANPTNGKQGHIYVWKIIQGSGAPHAVTFGGNFSFAQFPEPDLSEGAGDEDILFFYCDTPSKFVFTGALLGV